MGLKDCKKGSLREVPQCLDEESLNVVQNYKTDVLKISGNSEDKRNDLRGNKSGEGLEMNRLGR